MTMDRILAKTKVQPPLFDITNYSDNGADLTGQGRPLGRFELISPVLAVSKLAFPTNLEAPRHIFSRTVDAKMK